MTRKTNDTIANLITRIDALDEYLTLCAEAGSDDRYNAALEAQQDLINRLNARVVPGRKPQAAQGVPVVRPAGQPEQGFAIPRPSLA